MRAATISAPTVTLRVDGREIRVPSDITLAAALSDADGVVVRRSASGETRGPLCGMGTCYECRVTIDGVSHRRSCLVVVAEGMDVGTATSADR